ncbi:NAD-dependent dehydratase [candidate division WOR_3 bacterium SM23_60]|uniref:NAD-dependent dehydratase n=1 Tax=candidate division WOR_3 bacterium SM23_60 TaxID=1703780 RepID=A0A0S8G266_UNCW3|nr:MAG: NAD-dependent dehydratase [candidate division WOR_3 bacterium SM23_60]
MDVSGSKVLITGAGGFIGSHLAEELVRRGAEVKAFIRYNSRNDRGLIEILPSQVKGSIDVIMADLRNPDAIKSAAKNIDIIFHLAALIAIPYSYNYPREVAETNVMGTLNVLETAKQYKIKKIVHTSTSEVYGTAQYAPIDEQHPLQGQSPYSASKIGADKLVESYVRSFGVPVVTVRPFNTYGPRQSARAVIPTIISQALTQDEIHLGSLFPTRDLTYVKDIVDGFVKAAESDECIGEVVNLGSGFEISIGDLAKKILDLLKKDVKIISESSRVRPTDSEVKRLIADISKAEHLIGWKPTVSLDEGLGRTIEWFKKNIHRYKTNTYVI